MKKMIFLLKLILVGSLFGSCHDDDVVFIDEVDSLRIDKVMEFNFNENSGTNISEASSGDTFEVEGKSVNRMSGFPAMLYSLTD
jgi:beta-fructofuranosidase